MIIHPSEQGTPEWLLARAGLITASCADAILTPKFEPRRNKAGTDWGEGAKTYMAQLLAERWTGKPLEFAPNSFAMEQGSILETEARPWLALELNREIKEVGLCISDDGRCGASPDGIVLSSDYSVDSRQCGCEIKCSGPKAHVKYILAGTLPEDYVVQVHFSMFVTGFESWRFVSYRRKFPPLVLTVERDEKIQSKIAACVADFLDSFDKAFARMESMRG